jgi:tetratricopeptide (TPR) repeat protein
MGNFCLEREKPESALSFFQMAKKYYSNSCNVFVSLGQYYEKKGSKIQAQLSYEKALLLFPENKKVIALLKNLNK